VTTVHLLALTLLQVLPLEADETQEDWVNRAEAMGLVTHLEAQAMRRAFGEIRSITLAIKESAQ
jgi:hypothetical protein